MNPLAEFPVYSKHSTSATIIIIITITIMYCENIPAVLLRGNGSAVLGIKEAISTWAETKCKWRPKKEAFA